MKRIWSFIWSSLATLWVTFLVLCGLITAGVLAKIAHSFLAFGWNLADSGLKRLIS